MLNENDRGFATILILGNFLIVFGGLILLNQKFQFVNINNILPTEIASITNIYNSPKFKYQFKYSKIFTLEENAESGDVFLIPKGTIRDNRGSIFITVRHKTGDEESSKTPLEKYVKTAAAQEIQNYIDIASIETITTTDGDVGYKTTWNRTGPIMNGNVLNSTDEPSDPITYFGFPKEPSYTVQIYLYDPVYLEEYNQIIKTFSANKLIN